MYCKVIVKNRFFLVHLSPKIFQESYNFSNFYYIYNNFYYIAAILQLKVSLLTLFYQKIFKYILKNNLKNLTSKHSQV